MLQTKVFFDTIKKTIKNLLLVQCLFTYPDAHLSGQFWSEENSKKIQYVLKTNIFV